MAISVANPTTPSQAPAPASAPAPNGTQHAAGTTSPFQALLTTVSNSTAQATAAADTVSQATDNTDNTDQSKDNTATNTQQTGLLALAAQVLGLPANAAVAQATGQTAETTAATTAANAATRSRIDQLRLGRTGGFISATLAGQATPNPAPAANANTPAQTAANAAAADTAAANAAAANAAAANNPLAIPVPAIATAAQTATAVATQGGTSSIPAQAPIVTNLIPNAPVPVDASVTNPPVAEPTAPTAAAALPAAQLGDRPATAGDRFAAIAEAGAQLAASNPPSSVIFANTLGQELATMAANTGGTVLPLVNFSTQATAGVVLPPRLGERTGESRADDTSSASAAAINPQGPPTTLDGTVTATAVQAPAAATPAVQVADAVVSHAHVLQREGAVEFHMRLDPPSLGPLQVQLVTRGDEVHGQVLCANDAVRQMIESQLPELRQRLEAAGVSVQQFNVATDPNTGGGNQNAYRAAALPEEAAQRTVAATAAPPRARIGRVDAGSLDVTV